MGSDIIAFVGRYRGLHQLGQGSGRGHNLVQMARGWSPQNAGFPEGAASWESKGGPLAQNRGTILMGIVLWRVTENPKIAILGLAKTRLSKKKGYDLDIRPSGGNSGWHGWMRRQKLV